MTVRYHLYQNYLKVLGRNELRILKTLIKDHNTPYYGLVEKQFLLTKIFLEYCNNNSSFYNKRFADAGFNPIEMKNLSDLEYLPILYKADIIKNYESFHNIPKSSNSIIGSTGGSTGEPLKYSLSIGDYEMGLGLLYRGWTYAGYQPGDRVLVFAGSSLVGNSSIKSKINKYCRNIKSISSYGVSSSELDNLVDILISWKPAFLRGYASSLSFLAEHIIKNGIHLKKSFFFIKAVFSTAEMLSESSRMQIEEAFGCKVYNQYGLNDGGISAFENPSVSDGFLIDTERSVFECVNEAGENIIDKEGVFLATSFLNYDFPFVRYSTGDSGIITDTFIKKGGNRMEIINLNGRLTDVLKMNGRKISSPVLTVLMGKLPIQKYQIVQDGNLLKFIIRKHESFSELDEQFIRKSISEHLGEISMVFDYSESFIESKNKYKFIINLNE